MPQEIVANVVSSTVSTTVVSAMVVSGVVVSATAVSPSGAEDVVSTSTSSSFKPGLHVVGPET